MHGIFSYRLAGLVLEVYQYFSTANWMDTYIHIFLSIMPMGISILMKFDSMITYILMISFC